MNRFFLYALILVACKAWDLYATWLRTPDLQRELNPVTKLIGATWPAVLLQSAVVLALILWFVRRALVVDRSLHPTHGGLSVSHLFARIAFAEPASPWHLLYRLPTRPGATMYLLASLTLFAAPLGFLVAGASNWLLTRSPGYEHWFDAHLPWSLLLEALLVALASIVCVAWREYSAYAHHSSPPSTSDLTRRCS
jgi:hypothetical protein